MFKILGLAIALLILPSCASRSIKPDEKEIKLSREAADEDCKELGPVSGTTMSKTGTTEQAIEDLKKDAANKGANYVIVKEYSGYRTTVTGVAYDCP